MKSKLILAILVVGIVVGSISGIPTQYTFTYASPATIYVPDDYSNIQAAIDNADEGDTIIVRSDTYCEDIDVDKTLTIQGEDKETTIINGLGAYYIVDIDASDVIFSNFTVHNGSYGIYLDDADRSIISDCIIFNCTWDGVRGYGSTGISIIDCTISETDSGIDFDCSCFTQIINSVCYNNYWHGIEFSDTDYIQIVNCTSYNNTYDGIRLSDSNVASICNTRVYDNGDDGIDIRGSDKFYVSGSSIYDNDYGIYSYGSEGVIVNCNLTGNDYGLYSLYSNIKNKYCGIIGNHIFGVYNWDSVIDATECWWGSASGPYHVTLNPSGTGDNVNDDVEFDPWQTELYQPKVLISDLRCRILRAEANTVYYVPTGNIYDDSAFYAFYALTENPQIITSPTQSAASNAYLDIDGSPLFTGDIVTFGGRYANRMVAYFEDASIAKVGYGNNGTHHLFQRISDGGHLFAVDTATYNSTEKDYFVLQVYRDGERYVFSEWGICAEGTYAGGLCFINQIYPNKEDYTDSYYIFSWTDLNADGMPQPEEITLETS